MRRIVCVLFLVGVFSTNSVCGETLSEYRENLYDLFIQQKIPQWGAVLSKMSADKSCGTLEGRHEILCGYYGLVGHLVDKKKKDEAQAYLKTALALSENYRKMYPNDARFKALHANLIGLKIALSPMRAATLASGMLSSAREAYKLAPGIVGFLFCTGIFCSICREYSEGIKRKVWSAINELAGVWKRIFRPTGIIGFMYNCW